MIGYGYAEATADAKSDDWQQVFDPSDQHGVEQIPWLSDATFAKWFATIAEKFVGSFDPYYVLGLLHPEGMTGGAFTNFYDWIYFLQGAANNGLDGSEVKIVEFLRELENMIGVQEFGEDTGLALPDAHFKLRVNLALIAAGQKPASLADFYNELSAFLGDNPQGLNSSDQRFENQQQITIAVIEDLARQQLINPSRLQAFSPLTLSGQDAANPARVEEEIFRIQEEASQFIARYESDPAFAQLVNAGAADTPTTMLRLSAQLKGDDRVSISRQNFVELAFHWNWSLLPYRFAGEFTDQQWLSYVLNLYPAFRKELFVSHLAETAHAIPTWSTDSRTLNFPDGGSATLMPPQELLGRQLQEFLFENSDYLHNPTFWRDLLNLFPDFHASIAGSFISVYQRSDMTLPMAECWQILTGEDPKVLYEDFADLDQLLAFYQEILHFSTLRDVKLNHLNENTPSVPLIGAIVSADPEKIAAEIAALNEYVFLPRGYFLGYTFVDVPQKNDQALIILPYRIRTSSQKDVSGLQPLTYYYVEDAREDFPEFHNRLQEQGMPDNYSLQSHAMNVDEIARGDAFIMGADGPLISMDFIEDAARSYSRTLASESGRVTLQQHPFGTFLFDFDNSNNPEEALIVALTEQTEIHETWHYLGRKNGKRGEAASVLAELAGPHARLALFQYGKRTFGRDEQGRICLKHDKNAEGVVVRTSADNPYSAAFLYFLEELGTTEFAVPELAGGDLTELWLNDPDAFDIAMSQLLSHLMGLSDAEIASLASTVLRRYLKS